MLLSGDFEAALDGAEGAYLLHTESQAEAGAWAAKNPLIRNDPALSIG